MITKAAALKIMEKMDSATNTRKPFHIRFCTANRDHWKRYKALKISRDHHPEGSAKWREIDSQMKDLDLGGKIIDHPDTVLSGTRGIHVKKNLGQMSRNPNHWMNRTRNIILNPGGQIRKVRNALILQINHEKVLF